MNDYWNILLDSYLLHELGPLSAEEVQFARKIVEESHKNGWSSVRVADTIIASIRILRIDKNNDDYADVGAYLHPRFQSTIDTFKKYEYRPKHKRKFCQRCETQQELNAKGFCNPCELKTVFEQW